MNVLLKEEEGKRKGKNAQPQWHKTWYPSSLGPRLVKEFTLQCEDFFCECSSAGFC